VVTSYPGHKLRFLVTGGSGFIGSAFVRNLLNNQLQTQPDSLIVLDSLTYAGNLRNLENVRSDSRLKFIEGDIQDKELVSSLVELSDVVFNFAAETHVDRSIRDSEAFFKTNVLGTAILAQACINSGGKKFIQVSTDEVYGSIKSGSWNENSILEPNSPYAGSKAAAEMLLRGLGKTHGLDYRITRCSNNYGNYQHPEKVIPHFIWKTLNGLDLPVYGDGENKREWIHVDDHCAAIELVAINGKSQTIYNIGGGFELTNIALAQKIIQISGNSSSRISFVQDRKNHDYRYSIDDSRIRNELGFTQKKNFEIELKNVFDWYVLNRGWLEEIYSHETSRTL
jgi:dTDP-glucose 4,6-dehydratase